MSSRAKQPAKDSMRLSPASEGLVQLELWRGATVRAVVGTPATLDILRPGTDICRRVVTFLHAVFPLFFRRRCRGGTGISRSASFGRRIGADGNAARARQHEHARDSSETLEPGRRARPNRKRLDSWLHL